MGFLSEQRLHLLPRISTEHKTERESSTLKSINISSSQSSIPKTGSSLPFYSTRGDRYIVIGVRDPPLRFLHIKLPAFSLCVWDFKVPFNSYYLVLTSPMLFTLCLYMFLDSCVSVHPPICVRLAMFLFMAGILHDNVIYAFIFVCLQTNAYIIQTCLCFLFLTFTSSFLAHFG